MRLFIAIKCSSDFENTLVQAQNELRQHRITGNYTNCRNLHLTLAFIGEFPQPRTVLQTMQKVTFHPFELALNGQLGTFGDLYWTGLKKEPQLLTLANHLRQALADASIPYDKKPFRPHITLLRKARSEDEAVPDLRTIRLPRTSMTVDKISLMHSHRENGRLIYTELGFVPAVREGV